MSRSAAITGATSWAMRQRSSALPPFACESVRDRSARAGHTVAVGVDVCGRHAIRPEGRSPLTDATDVVDVDGEHRDARWSVRVEQMLATAYVVLIAIHALGAVLHSGPLGPRVVFGVDSLAYDRVAQASPWSGDFLVGIEPFA